MDIWQPDKLIWFLIFFIPGFVSVKIYDLLIPGDKRNFSESIFEVVGYTALNFAALCWLIIPIFSTSLYIVQPGWFLIFAVLILLVAPTLWPVILLRIRSWPPIAKHVMHPIQKPWDCVFSKKESYWTIIHLKDKRKIGGVFGSKSFASSYPANEQIYLEQLWELDEMGRFKKAIERSKGMIILGDDIVAVEFFE